MRDLAQKKVPRGSHPLRCPACQSAQVHLVPPEDEFVVIVCLSCYKRWAISAEPEVPEPPEVA
jgi:transcription elongation factor Elf1